MSSSTLTLARRPTAWLARAADYTELLRPRITALVLTVVAVSSYVASGGHPNGWLLFHTLLGTLLVAGSASAGNQWWERARDSQMARTADRPLPAGRLGNLQALLFVFATLAGGLLYLGLAVNAGTAVWGTVTWLLYVTVYTPLKSRTAWNTAVGACARRVTDPDGLESAVGGGFGALADPRCGMLFLIQVLWQFPHFMAIAWIYRAEYAAAGMQMLSVVDPTGRRAARHAVLGASALVPIGACSVAFSAGSGAGLLVAAAVVLGIGQLVTAWQFLADRSERSARRLLCATLVYLPLLLALHVLASSVVHPARRDRASCCWLPASRSTRFSIHVSHTGRASSAVAQSMSSTCQYSIRSAQAGNCWLIMARCSPSFSATTRSAACKSSSANEIGNRMSPFK